MPTQIELERFLPYRLSVLSNQISDAIAAAYQERFGLTIPEWRVIAVLARYPGLSAREVSHRTRMDAVAVSRAVCKLVSAGRVKRDVADSDRRRSMLRLSRAGTRVYAVVAPLALQYERELIAELSTSELAVLDRALQKLARRAETLTLENELA